MRASKTKPTAVLRRGFKAEAERIAVAYRKRIGLQAYDPLPAEDLARHMDVQILTPNDIPGMTDDLRNTLLITGREVWSAAIFKKGTKRYIIHNPTHSPARRESNLMHELAHAHCEHPLEGLETSLAGLIIPLRKYNEVQEAEADCLGGCLLLPRDALIHHHNFHNRSAEEIAELFNASLQMTRFRLGISGATTIKSRR